MKYIGNYQNNNLPHSNNPKLFAYLDEREIIISYDRENPFFIEQISILIDSENSLYAVFECGFYCETDNQAKDVSIHFTQSLIELIRNYTI
ncbi:MAG: hypothetical protein HUK14_04345 [Muribaculaceae bacterium]|nr:hypothetical protein [Muribaculaceae bacterium]